MPSTNTYNTEQYSILVLFSYECGDYILNDNPAGDLKILRNALSAVALQSFEGLERKGRRILRSQSYSSLDKG